MWHDIYKHIYLYIYVCVCDGFPPAILFFKKTFNFLETGIVDFSKGGDVSSHYTIFPIDILGIMFQGICICEGTYSTVGSSLPESSADP